MFHPSSLLAVSIFKDLSTIHQIKENVDAIELRLDLLPSLTQSELFSLIDPSTILTWKGGDTQKLFQALSCHPRAVDLPEDAPLHLFQEIKRLFPTVKIIASKHYFDHTPDNLPKLVASLKKNYVDHVKLATYANSTLDALRMLHCVEQTGCIGLCMGPLGTPTRLLAPLVGAPFTYAAPKAGEESAPGQLTVEEMLTTYRFRSLCKQTKIYALLGDPVDKSPSHITHNAIFEKIACNALYIKLPLKAEELAPFFSSISSLPFAGFSITSPLKEAVLPHLSAIDSEAHAIGAVNTLVHTPQGWKGYNTDGLGALEALGDVSGKHLMILGAGGAAKAIAFEAVKQKGRVTICNRTEDKGRELAQAVGAAFSPTPLKRADIVINATTLDQIPPCAAETFMDLSSSPELPDYLLQAQAQGRSIVSGFEMFVHQAARQFALWQPKTRVQSDQAFAAIKAAYFAEFFSLIY